jgi:cytochrome oxidase Cu insertion factor (SCO1/SenC/PrrC family)
MKSNSYKSKLAILAGLFLLIIGLLGYKKIYDTSYGFVVEKKAPTFILVEQNKNSLSLTDFKGKLLFLYFGYLTCKTSCPTSIGVIKQLSMRISSDDVNFVFINIDTERTTEEDSKRYANYFDKRFFLLSGSSKEISRLADLYNVIIDKESGMNNNYEINHTGHIFLIDKHLIIRRIYPSGFTDVSKILSDLDDI